MTRWKTLAAGILAGVATAWLALAGVTSAQSPSGPTLGSGIAAWLASPSSANLATALTDEISGTGAKALLGDQAVSSDSTVQHTAINLGHASDTTVTRNAAGQIAVEGVVVSGGPTSISVLTSGTAATYTVPAGIHRLWVRVQGPGGGGGASDGNTSQAASAGAGGGGAYAEKVYATTPGSTFTYTVPAGGAAGASGSASGSAGATATLWDEGGSVVTANSGGGGTGQASGTGVASVAGGAGGTATGGDVNLAGGNGMGGSRLSGSVFYVTDGGDSRSGFGGQGAGASADGATGTGYGGGGGGGTSVGNVDHVGAAGQQGVIIVSEYP